MDCVVSPVLQVFPVVELEVNVTEPPSHKVVGPLAVIVGVDKFTIVTKTAKRIVDSQPPTV